VFLDEFDKVSWTSARLAVLFEILDTVYAANGQLVISSNVSRKQLEAVLGKCLGPAVLRRVNESQGIATDGTVVEARMFDFFQPGPESPATPVLPAPVTTSVQPSQAQPTANTPRLQMPDTPLPELGGSASSTGKPRSKGTITNPVAQRNRPRKPTTQP